MIKNNIFINSKYKSIDQIIDKLKSNNICIIRNFINISQAKIAKKQINNIYKKKELAKLDFNKFSASLKDFNAKQKKFLPRYNYEISFPLNHKKYITIININKNISNMILKLIKKRRINKDYFFASRALLYPTNKGFLEKHRDKNAAKRLRRFSKKYFQVIVDITEREKDYTGGGPFFFIKNKKYQLGGYIKPGDAIIYNEKMFHGVDKIRSNNPKHLGRISLLSTIYLKYN